MRLMNMRLGAAVMIGLAGGALGGCNGGGQVILDDDSGTVIIDVEGADRGREYPSGGSHQSGRYESRLPKIPPGHMPGPGMCRIWFPGTPPGKQPAPVPCDHVRHDIPAGAWLIRG